MTNSAELQSQGPLTIRLEFGDYKSIAPPLAWESIPAFAVLTGENGSGKTQFLEALNGHLRPQRGGSGPFSNVKFAMTPNYRPHEVLFVPNMAGRLSASEVGVGQIHSHLNQIITNIRENKPKSDYHAPLFQAVRSSGRTASMTPSALLNDFTNELFYYDPTTIQQAVAFHCANYEIDRANRLKKGESLADANAALGPSPWSKINEVMESVDFPYMMIGADELDLRDMYRIRFRYRFGPSEVSIEDLSSGEITLVRLFFWLFVANQNSAFHGWFCWMNQNSHLHPTLTWSFVRGIHQGLVKTLNCRVIMSTHRPETIAFASEDAVFEMHRDHPRIRPSKGRHATVCLLTNNLVALVAGKRAVYVEDDADVDFYNATIDALVASGDWSHTAQPHFISSSIGKGESKDSGGKGKVKGWVKRLSDACLLGVVKGIIDQDLGNPGDQGIIVLDRNEHENYLVDPLVIYSLLIEQQYTLPFDIDPPLKLGDQHKLRELPEQEMQKVADAVLSEIRSHLSPAPSGTETDTVPVEYVGGKAVDLPSWLIKRGGRELIAAAHGKWPRIRRDSLLREYRRLRLIPRSLAALLGKCVLPE